MLNQADLPIWGCSLSKLFKTLPFWKQGPDFSKLDQSKWPKQPKPTGLAELITQPKDEWARDAQIYPAQIKAEKIEAAIMAAQVLVIRDEPTMERLLKYSSNSQNCSHKKKP